MIKITAIKVTYYTDLMEKYEIKGINRCNIKENDVFYTDGIEKPDNLCDSAWETLLPFIKSIIDNKPIYEDWMKDNTKAIISCNDGFRPISFLIEKI